MTPPTDRSTSAMAIAGKARILIVDDETEFADATLRNLQTRGYAAHAVYDGPSALRELRQHDYDVVILDLKMPLVDGLRTLRRMRLQGVQTQVLVLTGHGSVDTALEAMRIGAFDYLAKPCDIEELVEKVEGATSANLRIGRRA